MALFREVGGHGYRGSRVAATKYVATLRDGTAAVEPKRAIPSPRRITTWIMRNPKTLIGEQRDHLGRILAACPDLAHEFSAIARERRGEDLTAWATRALDRGP